MNHIKHDAQYDKLVTMFSSKREKRSTEEIKKTFVKIGVINKKGELKKPFDEIYVIDQLS